MTTEHPFILFFGSPERGQALLKAAATRDWWVYLPQDASEALGMYVTWMPDVVIIEADDQPQAAAELFLHLRSIRHEPLIIVSDDEQWLDQAAVVLPADTTIAALLDHVATQDEPALFSLS